MRLSVFYRDCWFFFFLSFLPFFPLLIRRITEMSAHNLIVVQLVAKFLDIWMFFVIVSIINFMILTFVRVGIFILVKIRIYQLEILINKKLLKLKWRTQYFRLKVRGSKQKFLFPFWASTTGRNQNHEIIRNIHHQCTQNESLKITSQNLSIYTSKFT